MSPYSSFRDLVVIDIPQPVDREPLVLDEDITARDAWLFAPLIAAAVALPIIVGTLLGVGAVHMVSAERSVSATTPTTFASRWPDQPMTVLR